MKNAKYLNIARSIAELSKDQSTKVGAFILGPEGEGGVWGYNGAPRGCRADEDHRFQNRPEKYFWAEHAERNAIFTAARQGFNTKGCSIVITHMPCMDCARAIVQAGIVRVIVPQPTQDMLTRWSEHFLRTQQLFKETGIKLEIVDEPN